MKGFVLENNRKEFVQTFKFVFSQLPSECIEKSLSIDAIENGYYYFYSLWHSEHALAEFMQSQEFMLIEGAFETLGHDKKHIKGQQMEIKIFRI